MAGTSAYLPEPRATGYTQFLLSRVALGVFEAPAFPASVRTVANFFHPKDRGRPTGLYTIGGDFGRLIGTPLLTALLLEYSLSRKP